MGRDIEQMQMAQFVEPLKEFVTRELLQGDASELDEETPLLEWGVLDSRSMVSMLAFIEDAFAVDVPDDAVRPEHFANIRSLATLLRDLSEQQQPGAASTSSIRALRPYGLQEGSVDLGQGRTLHQVRCAGMPPPWILLPEPGNSASIWSPILRSLEGDQAAAAFDLLGFGHSSSRVAEPRFDDQVELVKDGLTQLSSVPCVLVASGLSGWLAVELARRAPSRVLAVVLVGTGSPPDVEAWLGHVRDLATSPDGLVQRLQARPVAMPERTRRSIRRALAQPAHGLFLDSVAPVMKRGLAEVTAPVLLVAGDVDPLVPARDVAALAEGGVQVAVEQIPRCGHLPHLERTQELLMVIRQFLAPMMRL